MKFSFIQFTNLFLLFLCFKCLRIRLSRLNRKSYAVPLRKFMKRRNQAPKGLRKGRERKEEKNEIGENGKEKNEVGGYRRGRQWGGNEMKEGREGQENRDEDVKASIWGQQKPLLIENHPLGVTFSTRRRSFWRLFLHKRYIRKQHMSAWPQRSNCCIICGKLSEHFFPDFFYVGMPLMISYLLTCLQLKLYP